MLYEDSLSADVSLNTIASFTDAEASNCEPSELPMGDETVLLVEDEDFVRDITREVLEMSGYRVLEASNAQGALQMFAECGGQVHVLLTDIVMPGMSGHDLALRLCEQCPTLKTIYMSGYPGSEANRRFLSFSSKHYLQKPFTVESLTRKVREVLDTSDIPAVAVQPSVQLPTA